MTLTVSSVLASLAGGALIGGASALLFALNGRIAGVSGIFAGLFTGLDHRFAANAAFVAGLLLGAPAERLLFGHWPALHVAASWPVLMIAGLCVGFGTRLGSGCTSGHGVMGMARLSPRSFVAVATFIATAMLTVFLMRLLRIS